MKSIQLRYAAQADLILLTVDMLRPPVQDEPLPKWTTMTMNELQPLLVAARLDRPTSDKVTLGTALSEVIRQARNTLNGDWCDEYWRLFDSVLACPINQAAYVRRDKGAILGDVTAFYTAFGWHHSNRQGERPDHLLCQLEFVALLMAMAACAPSVEQQAIVEDGLEKFNHFHMHDWLPSFCFQLCESTSLPLFGAISNWLMLLWAAMESANQWEAGDSTGERLPPQADAENPYECAAGGLIQLGAH